MAARDDVRRSDLLSAGEFATLARTTKRTIIWYGAKEILLPDQVNESGHRFYRPQQIVDFQIILLMRGQGFSLEDIARHLADGQSLQQLFEENQEALSRQIADMQSTLDTTKRYYNNLMSTGTLVSPTVKEVDGFDVYYLIRKGPYAKIGDYHSELRSSFSHVPTGGVFLTVFQDAYYSPKSANMWIAVIASEGMVLKPGSSVRHASIAAYKAVSYVHVGSGALLSLITQQLTQYRRDAGLKRDEHAPFSSIEINHSSTPPDHIRDDTLQTEIQIPLTIT